MKSIPSNIYYNSNLIKYIEENSESIILNTNIIHLVKFNWKKILFIRKI